MGAIAFSLAVFAASTLAGTLGALLGIGGGMILVPFLTGALHVDLRLAIGASVISVIATSSGSAAAYLRDRLTNVRIGMFLELATTTGAIAGAALAAVLDAGTISVVFALVLAYSAAQMTRTRHAVPLAPEASSPAARWLRLPGAFDDPLTGAREAYGVTGVAPGLAIMAAAGALSGLLGIGSGAFKVIAMDRAMRLPLKVSTTTSNLMIGVTAATSAGVYFFRGDVDPVLATPVALGVLAGTALGTRLLRKVANARLRQLFVAVLWVLAAQMAWKGLAPWIGHGHG